MTIADRFDATARAVVFPGDCLELLRQIPDKTVQLVVTSPPYNIGKEYEKKVDLRRYVEQQAAVIGECCRVLTETGSICWQVGNYVDNGAIVPLDILLYPVFCDLGLVMRNRIVAAMSDSLRVRPMGKPKYEPPVSHNRLRRLPEQSEESQQLRLLELMAEGSQ